MSEEIKTRGNNKSFYHYYVNELNEETGLCNSPPKYYLNMKALVKQYGFSRATYHRIIKNPNASTRFSHKLSQCNIHTSAIKFINECLNENEQE
tara:strand:+ start:1108 stop:1389 length:282 start_codon:yes stop_codon:yes gene_type:complete